MASTDSNAGGSLADRVTKPETSTLGTQGNTQEFRPASGRSWADDVDSPLEANPSSENTSLQPGASQEQGGSNPPQVDGATEPFGGSGLHEPDYQVNVKLADMQADPNNPLYSAKTFEELNLYDIRLDDSLAVC